ncbi:rhomboid family intramembrane serine protease [Burkholderia sp. AU30198]|uniref:rhomboid family intramembrane serine protease n=1 Tax=Burkholderia sp. AU30198 TaxID=2879627 RepID=UPI001CF4DA22|nr:rhomboid family intramembrane serine protease [Burkholderia sp. AU30198]MCA8294850.1 rhomboid family intramembrane serine protease [Burkholderia sp. AU30198]
MSRRTEAVRSGRRCSPRSFHGWLSHYLHLDSGEACRIHRRNERLAARRWPPSRTGAPAAADFHIWQSLTCGRLHAGLAHVSFNMFGLCMFGPDVERVLGHARRLCRGRHVTGT